MLTLFLSNLRPILYAGVVLVSLAGAFFWGKSWEKENTRSAQAELTAFKADVARTQAAIEESSQKLQAANQEVAKQYEAQIQEQQRAHESQTAHWEQLVARRETRLNTLSKDLVAASARLKYLQDSRAKASTSGQAYLAPMIQSVEEDIAFLQTQQRGWACMAEQVPQEVVQTYLTSSPD